MIVAHKKQIEELLLETFSDYTAELLTYMKFSFKPTAHPGSFNFTITVGGEEYADAVTMTSSERFALLTTKLIVASLRLKLYASYKRLMLVSCKTASALHPIVVKRHGLLISLINHFALTFAEGSKVLIDMFDKNIVENVSLPDMHSTLIDGLLPITAGQDDVDTVLIAHLLKTASKSNEKGMSVYKDDDCELLLTFSKEAGDFVLTRIGADYAVLPFIPNPDLADMSLCYFRGKSLKDWYDEHLQAGDLDKDGHTITDKKGALKNTLVDGVVPQGVLDALLTECASGDSKNPCKSTNPFEDSYTSQGVVLKQPVKYSYVELCKLVKQSPVLLKNTTVLGVPISGTTKGSTYYCIGLGTLNLAIRWVVTGSSMFGALSLRLEGEDDELPDKAKALGFKTSKVSGTHYASLHVKTNKIHAEMLLDMILVSLRFNEKLRVTF